MAHNGNLDGYDWPNDFLPTDMAQAVDDQQNQQEYEQQSHPHPALEDAAQMAQPAYPAYFRAEWERQRAQRERWKAAQQSDANAGSHLHGTTDGELFQPSQAYMDQMQNPLLQNPQLYQWEQQESLQHQHQHQQSQQPQQSPPQQSQQHQQQLNQYQQQSQHQQREQQPFQYLKQYISNAQQQQHVRSSGVNSPTPTHQYNDSRPTESYTANSMALPQQFVPAPSPARLASTSQSHRPHSDSPAPRQTPSVAPSALQRTTSQSVPPAYQSIRPRPFGQKFLQYTGLPRQTQLASSHPARLNSTPAAPVSAEPQFADFRHPPGHSKAPPRPPSQPWNPTRVALGNPRINSPMPHIGREQAVPSKKRPADEGTNQDVGKTGVGIRTFKPANYLRDSPSRSHLGMRTDMIQPMDHNDAAKKRTYDPATIAHDVLINCGKHPTERSLNDHLLVLRNRFSNVDFSKDLTTFRWDLVDEYQSLVKEYKAQGPAEQAPAPPAPPALALPRAPPSAPVPVAPVAVPVPVPVVVPRLPVIAPASPAPHKPVTAFSRPLTSPTAPPPAPVDSRVSRSPATKTDHNKYNLLRELPVQPPTYRSRPSSTAPNLPFDLAPPHYESPDAPISSPLPPPPTPKPPVPTSKSTTKSTTKTTPRSNSKSTAQVMPTKRSSKHYPQPLVVIPPSPIKMSHKKRASGRPKRAVDVTIPAPRSTVQYPVFHCQWIECQSELHNLQALKSHLLQNHIPYSFTCKWDNCKDTNPKAAADMWSHVHEAHLGPVAWQFGDGPKVPVTADANPTRPNVPPLRNARPSTMTLPADNSMVVAFSRTHGNQALGYAERSAQAMIGGGIHWLENVGANSETSCHRISPVMCQGTVNQEEMALAN